MSTTHETPTVPARPERGITTAADVWAALRRNLEAQGTITAAQAGDLDWLYNYARNQKLSLAEVGRLLGVDAGNVSRVFAGKYQGSITNFADRCAAARRIQSERSQQLDVGFIETSVWKKIEFACDAALFDALPAFIFGETQQGKTHALERYRRAHNHGTTRLARIPAAPTLRSVLMVIAEACYLPTTGNAEELKARIIATLSDRNLLIIDELHQVDFLRDTKAAPRIVETIREIHDRTQCGIVICGTNVLKNTLENSKNHLIYRQFRQRGIITVNITNEPIKADILAIAAAVGLPPPDREYLGICGQIIRQHSIGRLIKLLKHAHRVAQKIDEEFAWPHVNQTLAHIASLAE